MKRDGTGMQLVLVVLLYSMGYRPFSSGFVATEAFRAFRDRNGSHDFYFSKKKIKKGDSVYRIMLVRQRASLGLLMS
jgi:hypothetical protein